MEQGQGNAFAPLGDLRKQFLDWWSAKSAERDEAKEARKYYHMVQWTAEQLKELKLRKQPAVTTPIFTRKINGFVGLIDRLRQDPKAYPRTLNEDRGAELCTAALRYALDQQSWPDKDNEVALSAAMTGIGGVEISLEPGDTGQPGDYDISIEPVPVEYFFYDPRSYKTDFSDARFMGVSKWFDVDEAKRLFPEFSGKIDALAAGDDEFSTDSDRDNVWVATELKRIRIVEHWYQQGDTWLYAFYTGAEVLDQGRTFLRDEKGRDRCRFMMFSAAVDQDGDRYAFHRNMKSLVDEINHRNSKALHLLNMRRIRAERGAFDGDDLEAIRREAARPDGIVLMNPGMKVEFEDAKSLQDMQGQLAMLDRAKVDIENYGPNPALVGQGVENRSGRAIQLMQQAGLAELGPFLRAYKGWKIRLYKQVWSAIQQYWTGERFIRVTDDEGQQQPVPVNAQVDPQTGRPAFDQTGQPVTFNDLGALDVDIVIDEGPDSVTVMADALETLQAAASQGQQIPPQVMLELLPIPDSLKRKLSGMLKEAQQPNPVMVQGAQLDLAQKAAKVDETNASAQLKLAQAQKAGVEAQLAPMEAEADAQARAMQAMSRIAQPQETPSYQ